MEADDEGAFYGPKVDVQIRSTIGREFTLATNQVDFAVPARFNLLYKDKDGSDKTPICIHRAPLSTHERFIGFLIEHYAGAFPFWLSPEQVKIVPVADAFLDYAHEIKKELKAKDIRCSVDESGDSFSKKIRNGEIMKTPYVFVVGEQEVGNKTVNVRDRDTKTQYEISLKEFLEKVK